MVSWRARKASSGAQSVPLAQTSVSPATQSGSQAILYPRALLARDASWLLFTSLVYLILVVASVLTLHAYFSQTWDAVTFIKAGKLALSPEWNALYALSRAEQTWPLAYPPFHAFLVAPFVSAAGILPDYLLVRVPPLLFDLALGILLYLVVAHKSGNRNWARLTLVVWLLNPVTWYDTAVQGHFEAEWLFFVALAYYLYEIRRGWLFPTLALAVAFLFKQNAVLFALPFWAHLLFSTPGGWSRRIPVLLSSAAAFALPILLVSLPFLSYSNDYWFMVVQYVTEVPLQTQSWLIALAVAFGRENLMLQASSALALLTALLISLLAIRRKMDLWFAAFLIVLSFFLLSKKVVGYYYVMILPFALVSLVPTRHFNLLAVIVAATAFISLSPYFADWSNPADSWVYAVFGVANSLLWLGILLWLWSNHPLAVQFAQNARTPAYLSIALFFGAVAASLLQPLIASQSSPIRAPLVASGAEGQTFWIGLVLALLVVGGLFFSALYTRTIAREQRISRLATAGVLLLAPLYFLTFTLTKESTAALGVILEWFRVQ
jgi:hypothetical protein